MQVFCKLDERSSANEIEEKQNKKTSADLKKIFIFKILKFQITGEDNSLPPLADKNVQYTENYLGMITVSMT